MTRGVYTRRLTPRREELWARSAKKEQPSPWDSVSLLILNEMWAAGYSASQIAHVLGPQFTRNSVIGKIFRMRAAAKEAA